MEAALLGDASDSSSQHSSQSQFQYHPHVPKVFALPDSTPEETDDEESCGGTNATTKRNTMTVMIQLVRRGEGKDRMKLSNFGSSRHCNDNSKTKELSFHRPILIRDTPESIGMKIPTKPKAEPQSSSTSASSLTEKSTETSIGTSSTPRKRKGWGWGWGWNRSKNESSSTSTSTSMEKSSTPKKRKRRKRNSSSSNGTNHDETTTIATTTAPSMIPLSIRDIANIVGPLTPVQMINVLDQQLDLGLLDWTFHDLVEYFEDQQRIARNRNGIHQWLPKTLMPEHRTPSPTSRRSSPRNATTPTSASPPSISPTTGRSRRQAAIKAKETLSNIMNEDLSSVGGASKKILNQISYEFSGTPLHSMVRSPAIVREVDWIDHAWPAEKKPKHNEKSEWEGNNNNKILKKAHKGIKSVDYPLVQYYCLTSAAGSYTDFHIDFGGSSVWYHVVTGQKIFVVAPPTRPNLRVFEEWLSHADNLKLFFPELLKEREGGENHGSSSSSTHQKPQSPNHALRFTLNAGETLILPAGWIHAVYSPVDSLVFGGNFLHGWDIRMQLTVNGIETRSKIADQLRFPHFGALQMYAGGMYLDKLRAMGKENQKTGHSETGANDGNVQSDEEEQKTAINSNDEAKTPNSSTRISPREFEELLVLINVLDRWWSLEPALADPRDARTIKKKEKTPTSASKSLDLVTWHSSFREAAFYVTKKSGCKTVQDFIAVLRDEYSRVSKEFALPCDNTPGPSSTLPVPTAIEAPNNSQKNNTETPKQEEKKTRIRKGASEMDDPLDVVLSKSVREYLASIQITTAAQLLLSNTAEVAKHLPQWRQQKGLPALKGRAGAAASVSVWKRKVRLRAAEVGATKLSQVNQGTNMKPLGIHDKDKGNDENKESRKTFPPPNDIIRKGSLVKGFFLLSEEGKL